MSKGVRTFYLDGDNVHGLNGDLGFSPEERKENIRRVAEVAKLAFEHGNVVLCTFISPYREDRGLAARLLPAGRFFELYVKCDLDVAKRHDPKGLYAKAFAARFRSSPASALPTREAAEAPAGDSGREQSREQRGDCGVSRGAAQSGIV